MCMAIYMFVCVCDDGKLYGGAVLLKSINFVFNFRITWKNIAGKKI